MTSSMRSRDRITRLSGRTIPRPSASRKSRIALPATSEPDADAAAAAGCVAREAVWPARFCAVCWRPRAWPPRLAAARRLAEPEPPREEDAEREDEVFLADDRVDRLDELLDFALADPDREPVDFEPVDLRADDDFLVLPPPRFRGELLLPSAI